MPAVGDVDLIDDQVDLAVRIGPLADSSMVTTRVASVRRVVCASPAYLTRFGAESAGRPGQPCLQRVARTID